MDNDSTRAPQSSARTGLVICGVTSCILLNELVEEVKGVGVSAPYRPTAELSLLTDTMVR